MKIMLAMMLIMLNTNVIWRKELGQFWWQSWLWGCNQIRQDNNVNKNNEDATKSGAQIWCAEVWPWKVPNITPLPKVGTTLALLPSWTAWFCLDESTWFAESCLWNISKLFHTHKVYGNIWHQSKIYHNENLSTPDTLKLFDEHCIDYYQIILD